MLNYFNLYSLLYFFFIEIEMKISSGYSSNFLFFPTAKVKTLHNILYVTYSILLSFTSMFLSIYKTKMNTKDYEFKGYLKLKF